MVLSSEKKKNPKHYKTIKEQLKKSVDELCVKQHHQYKMSWFDDDDDNDVTMRWYLVSKDKQDF